MDKTRYTVFFVTLFIVLALSSMNAVPVLADDEVPPPSEPSEVVDPPTPVEVTEAEELPLVVDAGAETVSEVLEVSPPVEDPADTEVVDTQGLISQIPEGTDLVVVNAEGDVVPLASQEAAEIIAGADPIWCPASVATPVPGVSGCTNPGIGNVNYDPTKLSSLLAYLAANQPGVDGVIWIEKGYDSSVTDAGATSYVLDGSVLSTMANFAITIKGGWNGLGTNTIDASDPSEINVPLSIVNWNGNVTLSDLLITNVVGGGSTALAVETTKNITVNRVEVSNNAGIGAEFDNTGGTGIVTVSSGKFNSNANGNGLYVHSKGLITLNSIQANGNGYSGAVLDNHTAPAALGVIVNTSEFNGNAQVNHNGWWQIGLEVYTKGVITIKDIDAMYNGNVDADSLDLGVYLDNTYGVAGVTLTGVNIVAGNEAGIWVYSYGAVTLNNLVANNNRAAGLYVDNCGWNGATCNPLYTAPVSILGTNEFKFNSTGLQIFTNGAIILNNITANRNADACGTCGGAYLWNANSPLSAAVTLTGINTFRENSMTGLQIYSKGVVTLNNITANDNGWYDDVGDFYVGEGVHIDNTYATTAKAVTLNGLNSTMSNATHGLVVYSFGSITVNALTANWNGWAHPLDVDPYDGSSYGTGAILDNCYLNNAGTPLDDNDDYCNSAPISFVKLTGTNSFLGNAWGNGLYVSTVGMVTISNITANDNGSTGVVIDNNWLYWNPATSSTKLPYSGTTITEYASASNNAGSGLSLYSTGVVTLNNVTANANNGGYGLYIWNRADQTAKNVTLNGTNIFNDNWRDGLRINTYGVVMTNNVSARSNGHYDSVTDTYYGYGVYINNCGWNVTICAPSTPISAVTMNGNNIFSSNALSGLQVYSRGAIKVNQITANYNGWVDQVNEDYWDHDNDTNTPDVPNTNTVYGYGAFLYNRDGLAPVTITGLNGAYFDGNWNSGLHIESRGAITVDKLTSIWNGQEDGLLNNVDPFDTNDANGAYLDNMWSGAVGDVIINGYSRTENNQEYGLATYSNGNVKLTAVSANNNGFKGVHVDNAMVPSAAPKTVSITGTNYFNGNGAHGLVIKSFGAITLNNINASWNAGAYNAYIDNCRFNTTGCTALTQAAIILTGVNSFDGNWGGGGGLYMQSFGNITIANLSANDNDSEGAYIDNQWFNEVSIPVASLGVITITGYASFDRNGLHGLYAYSNGNIAIANLNANNNGGNGSVGGAYLDATKPGVGIANVVLTGYNNFIQNYGGDGLTVYADGNITIANLTANENWNGSGAYLDNRVTNTLPMSITLTGTNNFWHNFVDGLTVMSYGVVALNSIDASSNGIDETWSNVAGPEYGWGIYIDNRNPVAASAKSVTLTGFNNFSGNWNSGLEVWSSNLVTLSNVTANFNGNYFEDTYAYAGTNGTYVGCGNQTVNAGDGDFYVGCGVYVDNTSAVTPMNVVFLGVNEFYGNTHHGLKINSKGQILLSAVAANNNGWYAGWDASPDTVFGSGVYLISTMKGITFTGKNTFDGNWDDGLFAQALDPITVSNLNANNNGDDGAYLDNLWDVKHSDVVVTGYAYVSNNGANGLVILTNGSVSMTNVVTSFNGVNGLYVEAYDNNLAPLGRPSNVTIAGTNWFWGNGYDGLSVLADGVITLNNINSNHNGNNGAKLDGISTGYWMPLPLVRLNIMGVNNFTSNANIGLYFDTFGNVTLISVTADDNGTGILGATTGNVTFTCGSLTHNGSSGYDLSAMTGTLTLTGVMSTGNLAADVATASSVVRVRACPLP